jgi:hypothetical protein
MKRYAENLFVTNDSCTSNNLCMAWLHRDSPLDLHSTDNQILFGHECFKFHFPPSRSDCLEEIALEAFGWRKREVFLFSF